MTRIALVCPGKPIQPDRAAAVVELAEEEFPATSLRFHPQCFAEHGHFAGDDAKRLSAFLEVANDPAVDAVWFAMGGYGLYVWGSFAVMAFAMLLEPWLLIKGRKSLIARLKRQFRAEKAESRISRQD